MKSLLDEKFIDVFDNYLQDKTQINELFDSCKALTLSLHHIKDFYHEIEFICSFLSVESDKINNELMLLELVSKYHATYIPNCEHGRLLGFYRYSSITLHVNSFDIPVPYELYKIDSGTLLFALLGEECRNYEISSIRCEPSAYIKHIHDLTIIFRSEI